MAVVDLWLVPLDVDATTLQRAWQLIDGPERRRAAAFRFARDRRRFVVARAQLRLLLARRVGVDPAVLRFGQGRYGKPELAHRGRPSFSLSRSGDLALLGLSDAPAIGVDIEWLRSDLEQGLLAETILAPSEISAPVDAATVTRAFVRKEAYLKAVGTGLDRPLPSVEFTPVDGGSGPLWELDGWYVHEAAPVEDAFAAIAAATVPTLRWQGVDAQDLIVAHRL